MRTKLPIAHGSHCVPFVHSKHILNRLSVKVRAVFGSASIKAVFCFAMLLVVCADTALSEGVAKVELAKKGDRILLYEYATGLYFATAGLDFENMAEISRNEGGAEALEGHRMQAGIFAFMCYLDRIHVHMEDAPDMFSGAVANGTRRRLMKRLDWESFARYARSQEAKALIQTYFKNYPEGNLENDLQSFRKWCDEDNRKKQVPRPRRFSDK